MKINEAIKVMNTFVKAYEHAQKTEFVDKLLHVKSDYEATKVVLKEYRKLKRDAKYYEDLANQQTRDAFKMD